MSNQNESRPPEGSDELLKSRIYIEFEGMGSATFSMKVENVVPMQLLALAQYFEFEGKLGLSMQRAQMMEEQQRKHIQVPGKE
jgi:hypothetical protein